MFSKFRELFWSTILHSKFWKYYEISYCVRNLEKKIKSILVPSKFQELFRSTVMPSKSGKYYEVSYCVGNLEKKIEVSECIQTFGNYFEVPQNFQSSETS